MDGDDNDDFYIRLYGLIWVERAKALGITVEEAKAGAISAEEAYRLGPRAASKKIVGPPWTPKAVTRGKPITQPKQPFLSRRTNQPLGPLDRVQVPSAYDVGREPEPDQPRPVSIESEGRLKPAAQRIRNRRKDAQ